MSRPPLGQSPNRAYERTACRSSSSTFAVIAVATCASNCPRRPLARMRRRRRRPSAATRRAACRRRPPRGTGRGARPSDPTPDTGSTCGASARTCGSSRKRRRAKQPFSSVMSTLRAPISAIASRAIRKSSSSSSSCPTSCSASRWLGETRTARPGRRPGAARPRCRVRRARRDERARGSCPRRTTSAPWSEPARTTKSASARGSGASRRGSEVGGGHLRAPLVDLRVRAGRRIDHGRRGARLGRDPDEVVEDRLGGELLDDARSRPPAGQPGRDQWDVQALERARHVDPLPPASVSTSLDRCRNRSGRRWTVSVRSRR